MSVPGTRMMSIVTPQGSQSALERLTPPVRGKMMHNIIAPPESKSFPTGGPKNPFAKAPGDASRWAGIAREAGADTGRASTAWVKAALQRRRDHCTTTDGPAPAVAAKIASHPLQVPEKGIPSAMGYAETVPDKYNLWNTPGAGATETKDAVPVGGSLCGGAMAGGAGGSMKSAHVAKLIATRKMDPQQVGKNMSHSAHAIAYTQEEQRKDLEGKVGSKKHLLDKLSAKDLLDLMRLTRGRKGLRGGGMGSDSDSDSDGGGFNAAALVGGRIKRKRRAPGADSKTMRRARLCSQIARERGITMIAASRAIRAENLKF